MSDIYIPKGAAKAGTQTRCQCEPRRLATFHDLPVVEIKDSAVVQGAWLVAVRLVRTCARCDTPLEACVITERLTFSDVHVCQKLGQNLRVSVVALRPKLRTERHKRYPRKYIGGEVALQLWCDNCTAHINPVHLTVERPPSAFAPTSSAYQKTPS